jgi:hypothetical protein
MKFQTPNPKIRISNSKLQTNHKSQIPKGLYLHIVIWNLLVICNLEVVFLIHPFPLHASEVIEPTRTQVIVREHPKTGRPYVSIVSSDRAVPPDPFSGQKKYSRPDYRLLDPKVKAGEIPYDGPYSDRRKIYIFAATLATVGTVGGVAGMAAAPAAAGAGASGGGAAYLAGGTAVAAGSAAAVTAVTHSDPKEENFIHRSESKTQDVKAGP